MNVCVIGFGSIGRRHAEVLQFLGHEVSVVSRREVDWPQTFKNLNLCLSEKKIDYFVVAGRTNEHADVLAAIIKERPQAKILVEKPIFKNSEENHFHHLENVFVGHNLRFHPVFLKLKELLRGEKILSVSIYVGQYLPSWRPGQKIEESYSASREQGGGVLRDLSHELDYMNALFGPWKSLCSQVGKWSDLPIDSEDHVSVMLATEKCPMLQVQLNYVDRITQRFIIVNTQDNTFKCDFIKGEVTSKDKNFELKSERNETYIKLHQAMLSGDFRQLCSFKEGVEVLKLIEAIELASEGHEWIYRT